MARDQEAEYEYERLWWEDTMPLPEPEEEAPYCIAQVGGMECGQPVEKWGQHCERH